MSQLLREGSISRRTEGPAVPNTGVGQVWPRADSWIWQHEVTPDLEKSSYTGGVRARGRNAYFIGFQRNGRIGDREYKLEFCYKGRQRNGGN